MSRLTEAASTLDIERRIVGKAVDDLLAAGFQLSVNDGEDIVVVRSTDKQKIMDALWSTDEDRLIVFKGGSKEGWVYLVHGNGWCVISDYTSNLEGVLKGANDLADAIDNGTEVTG